MAAGDLKYNDLIWAYHWENYFVEIIKKLSTIDTMHADFVHHVMNAAFLIRITKVVQKVSMSL